MALELREITTNRDLKKFVKFPFSLYKKEKYWVPPLIGGEMDVLRSDRNPAFDHCEAVYVLAYKDGKLAGRISGIINNLYNESFAEKQARFSWFDFINDDEVSRALLAHIENWAVSKGMTQIAGPIGFTTFDRQGVVVEGFDVLPTISSTYNFPYYEEHFEKLGYKKKSDYIEFEITVPKTAPDRPERITKIIEKKYKLKVLNAKSRKELIAHAEPFFEVMNAAYGSILGFVPLTKRQSEFFVKKYFSIIQPGYTTIVKDENGRLIGFQIAMPSLSRAFQKARGKLLPFGFLHIMRAIKKPKRIDLLLVGALPEYQSKGVNAFFMNEITKICQENNIIFGETNGLLEENVKVQSFTRYFETRQHKRRRLYFKDLT